MLSGPSIRCHVMQVRLTAVELLQDVLQKTASAAAPLLSKAREGVAAAFSKLKPAAQSEPPNVEL